MEDKIRKELDQEVDQMTAMFDSCEVKGAAFKNVAMASFEAQQLMDIIGTSMALVADGESGAALDLIPAIRCTLTSIVMKVGEDIDQQQMNEAIEFGINVHRRKEALQERIQKMI